jgi:hypothetical protein
MTQDQHGQAPGTGDIVGGEVVRDDEADASPAAQTAPMTRFQKVAAALRGDRPDPPAPGQEATQPSLDAQSGQPGEVADQTRPEAPDTQDPTITQPDIYGTAARGHADVALAAGSLLPEAAEFKARWRQVQFMFVDDPQGSVADAADVIAHVAARLEAAIQERQRALRGRWAEDTNADTETLRTTLLMYRAFLDQLTGPTDS